MTIFRLWPSLPPLMGFSSGFGLLFLVALVAPKTFNEMVLISDECRLSVVGLELPVRQGFVSTAKVGGGVCWEGWDPGRLPVLVPFFYGGFKGLFSLGGDDGASSGLWWLKVGLLTRRLGPIGLAIPLLLPLAVELGELELGLAELRYMGSILNEDDDVLCVAEVGSEVGAAALGIGEGSETVGGSCAGGGGGITGAATARVSLTWAGVWVFLL
ncbi:hypothetical protein RchiOBHm_Chr4g0400081 [Rosa chinensis]|uniref:Uncharacterized protein n=1 Tax=Rosa chinensis TaxID=74649 RepID=A0A2P6QSR6_ROSCH|nr:hypothetical protein RchiOBHm_Chr4g0400081 [Rosa chinensis]